MEPRFIRNFAIIAHIDHGKSTLADRFLELTGALQAREMEAQVLDTMDLERERGITIKAHPVRLNYTSQAGEQYVLNLIDTPGHVDFTGDGSLAARGRALLVDASQGVEGATLANVRPSRQSEIIPVINKIDLPGAQPGKPGVRSRTSSASTDRRPSRQRQKQGLGVPEILEAIVGVCRRRHKPDAPLKRSSSIHGAPTGASSSS
jgi:GTP-binding protein LepA